MSEPYYQISIKPWGVIVEIGIKRISYDKKNVGILLNNVRAWGNPNVQMCGLRQGALIPFLERILVEMEKAEVVKESGVQMPADLTTEDIRELRRWALDSVFKGHDYLDQEDKLKARAMQVFDEEVEAAPLGYLALALESGFCPRCGGDRYIEMRVPSRPTDPEPSYNTEDCPICNGENEDVSRFAPKKRIPDPEKDGDYIYEMVKGIKTEKDDISGRKRDAAVDDETQREE